MQAATAVLVSARRSTSVVNAAASCGLRGYEQSLQANAQRDTAGVVGPIAGESKAPARQPSPAAKSINSYRRGSRSTDDCRPKSWTSYTQLGVGYEFMRKNAAVRDL